MKAFIEVNGLLELEQAEKWNEAIELLYGIWYSDKGNVSKLCRLISECWYVLTEWDCFIQNKELSFDAFKKILVDTIQYGLARFNTDENFLWIAGYMISLFPYLFYESDEDALFTEWEQKGKDMLLLATRTAPNNLIAKVLYLGTQGVSDEYLMFKAQLAPHLNELFTGCTAIEEYFKDILSF